jgi:ABC-type Na+ efflux pump permease subunit
MPGLCQYSNIFGAPGTGSHQRRIGPRGGVAVVDLLATGGLTLMLAYGVNGRKDLLSLNFALTIVLVFIILMIVAVFVHEAFCVNTRLNAAIFCRPWTPPLDAAAL